jgi:hypothetical protein
LLNAYRDYLLDPLQAKPHFLILDEMNLARVEYYLSDVLSLMETGCRVDPRNPLRVMLGELARVHPLETCVTSQGLRGIVATPPALRPPGAESADDPQRPGPSEPARARPNSDDQLVPLWELEEDRWLYEPLVRGARMVEREPRPPSKPQAPGFRRRSTLEQLFPIPPRIAFPPNLVVIGTVNVDETTFGFAPKVLDRAFVIDLSRVDHDAVFAQDPRYPRMRTLLDALGAILGPRDLRFGYRVVAEMLDYAEFSARRPWPQVQDELVLSKVLPRISGSEERISLPLRQLLALCIHGLQHEGRLLQLAEIAQAAEVEALAPAAPIALPQSAAKLLSMGRRLSDTGFTAFF